MYGPYLEHLYQDQLNRAFVVFRNSSQDDERLDYLSRLYLLELIELRAKNWKGTDFMYQYYKNKISQCAQVLFLLIYSLAVLLKFIFRWRRWILPV